MSDDAAVLAEIARLTSAIEQHKDTASRPTPPPYTYRGRGRGRGRGGSTRSFAPATTTHRNSTWVAPGLQQPPSRSSTATPAEASTSRPTTPALPPTQRPTGGYRNQTLVLNPSSGGGSGGTTPVRNGIDDLGVGGGKDKAGLSAPPTPVKREVVIDGVVFVADARGNKLVRKPDADPSALPPSTSAPPSPSLSTPKRTSHLGTTYIRTKSGNLVSLAFARRRKELADAKRERDEQMRDKGERLDKLVGVIKGVQGARNAAAGGGRGRGRGRGRGGYTSTRRVKPPKPKSDKPCRFFQRTGQCTRAHTCPYVHDSSHIAICPAFLRSSCPNRASTCPLSHTPNAHRSPHCAHFPSCTRPNCPYAHIQLGKDAPVCRDFVDYGYCPRGEECAARHVRECWRFAETGRCEVKGCREPHVLRRKHDAEEDSEEDEDEEGSGGEEEEGGAEMGDGAALGAPADGGAAGGKRKRRESSSAAGGGAVGISGAAGRRLTKKLRQAEFDRQEDFVELMVPLSDEEDAEDDEGEEEEEGDEEGMSVDSDDLDEDVEEEEEDADAEDGAAQAAPDPDLVQQIHLAKKDPPPASALAAEEGDELDYTLTDDEDDAVQIEQLLRR
ncbi:hypothetical protein JCM8097_002477 [Rhodosporidiobolus ruineniae]